MEPLTVRHLILVLESDPAAGMRYSEALRLGCGLLAWRQVNLVVCLCGPARRGLALAARDPVSTVGEDVVECLNELLESGALAVLRDEDSALGDASGDSRLMRWDIHGLASRISAGAEVMHFR